MPALNIFKIYAIQQENLVTLLEEHGITHTERKIINQNEKEYELNLYFTQRPQKNHVKWITELQREFQIGERTVDHYSAVVLIKFDGLLFASSYGSSHFYISRYADLDFGIEIAARILNTFKVKSSREFAANKFKGVETYHSLDTLAFEAGEAVDYIRGTPHDKELWGNNISCGQSIQLRKRDFNISNIYQICERLEAVLSTAVITEIPRLISINKKDEIDVLTEKLAENIANGNYMLNMSELQLSGVAILFSNQYDFFLLVDHEAFLIDEDSSLAQLGELTTQRVQGDYKKLLSCPVELKIDDVVVDRKSLMSIIDYVDHEGFFLNDGRWYRFDTNYLHNIRLEVGKIFFEFSAEVPVFDEAEYVSWKDNQAAEQKHYRERYLNELISNQFGYHNGDRDLELFEGAAVEIADLYKDNTIYVVKIGTPQKLNYAIDQATGALKVLQRQGLSISIDQEDFIVKSICLWLFIERQTDIVKLSDLNSLVFLTKLATWRKLVLLSGLIPKVRVSYRRS